MNRRMLMNLLGQLTTFVCSLGISFWITPFVVQSLGAEAYGYVNLATGFTSYISLFAVAITSMLSRYVTIEFSKKNFAKASEYFSTAFFSELFLVVILIIPSAFFIANMEHFVNILPENIDDVKILWTLVFVSFLINLPLGCYNIGSFTSNRLDLKAIVTIIFNITKSSILLITFLLFPPKVWYIGLATILADCVTIWGNLIIKSKHLPEVKLSVKLFRKNCIYDLVVVGIWNSISRLSQILNTGLDLLLANVFINGSQMGILSIAKSIPAQLGNLSGSIYIAFEPSMTITYADGDNTAFINEIIYTMKLNGFLCSIPIIGFLCFGKIFYSLWMPSLTVSEINDIYILAIFTMLPQIFEIYVQPLYAVNTITQKLRLPVIINILSGILNIILVLLFLKFTDLGIYAIAGVSSIIYLLYICIFMPIYAAHCVKNKLFTFAEPLLLGFINTAVLIFVFVASNFLFIVSSWSGLVSLAIINGIAGYIISFFVMFNKIERQKMFTAIKSKFKI